MNAGTSLIAHMRENAARLAAACTACGACYRACPMVPETVALAGADSRGVMAGIRDLLIDAPADHAPGFNPAVAFASACTRSGVCTPACPEKLDAAFMMRLANLRVRGALGDPPLVRARHDPGWSARVKAFARLTMSEQEQAEWL